MSPPIKFKKSKIAISVPSAPTVAEVVQSAAKVESNSVFDRLSDGAYLREAQLVRSTKRPDSTAPLPFSAPTLWRKVRAGTFPAPCKLSERVTAWRVGDVRQWLQAQAHA